MVICAVLMLQKLIGLYPDTQTFCMTLIEANGGLPLIDVHKCGMLLNELL